ncbi:MAG: hemerythrin domain-containing protein [Hylemonella sp.]|nr:hemerythrin domain-containing protein [Hylemonella sp.]
MGQALPGFETPAVGFETPYEMLAACHERVQRSLELLGRLLDYVGKNGHDAQTRSAAADVLRYFDLAAPLHHQDEELHVFPLLLAQGDAALREQVLQLQAEHRQMEALWATLRQPLLRWREDGATESVNATLRETAARFARLYAGHIPNEESLVFPAARAAMSEATQAGMGAEMQARRRG